MNENILVVKQDNENTYTTDYVLEVFNTSSDLNLIKSVVERADERVYVTWATVEVKDKAGEIIPINDFIRTSKTLMKRGAPIMDSHTNAHVGKTLAYKIMQHPKTQTLGVLQLNKIFSDNKKDDEVWYKIKSGEYKGSSVGGFVSGKPQYDLVNNSLVRTLNGFDQFETSAVKDPCNPFAINEGFSVVAKSYENDKQSEKMEESKKEETKKASVLEMIMAKVANGEELSPEETNALQAAMSAAESAMKPAENSQNNEEESKEDMQEEDKPESEEEKEDPEQSPETQEDNTMSSNEDKVSELEKSINQLIERMDMIEDQLSGSVDKEDEDTNEESDTEETSKQVKKEEVTTKDTEEESKEEAAEPEKMENAEVIKANRPASQSSKVYTAFDIAMGKAKFNPQTNKIESK